MQTFVFGELPIMGCDHEGSIFFSAGAQAGHYVIEGTAGIECVSDEFAMSPEVESKGIGPLWVSR